jgi:putative membrane protein
VRPWTLVLNLADFKLAGLNARVPLALLIAVVYLLKAATGGSLFALLRRSYEESRRSLTGSR